MRELQTDLSKKFNWITIQIQIQELQKSVQRYTVVPKPKQDYNDDDVIDTDDTPFIEPGDDFGFTETSTFFGDGKEFAPNRGVDI